MTRHEKKQKKQMEMENEMNRAFEFEGRGFNVKVTLNHLAERRPGGMVLHKVAINEMGPSDWRFEQVVPTQMLEETIGLCESKAKGYVLGSTQLSPEERLLTELGFK
jgi:hypothetical protein